MNAKVTVLGGDAVTDEISGASFYSATLTLMQRQMGVPAEMKTGKRRIIEVLMSPIERARHESLRER